MRHEFHPEALDEYESAARYYAERRDGLELRFIACVEAAILRITETPTRWRIFEADVRCRRTQVFPYAILYTIESDYVLIVAVMHGSREPGYWRHRIPHDN